MTEPMRQLLECKRCGYGAKGEWRRRTKGRLPKQCPNCKSYRWNEDEVRGRGRPVAVKEQVQENYESSAVAVFNAATCDFFAEPVTVTATTIAEAKDEESAPVMIHDMPMVQHGAGCGCTECMWQRGEL